MEKGRRRGMRKGGDQRKIYSSIRTILKNSKVGWVYKKQNWVEWSKGHKGFYYLPMRINQKYK